MPQLKAKFDTGTCADGTNAPASTASINAMAAMCQAPGTQVTHRKEQWYSPHHIPQVLRSLLTWHLVPDPYLIA